MLHDDEIRRFNARRAKGRPCAANLRVSRQESQADAPATTDSVGAVRAAGTIENPVECPSKPARQTQTGAYMGRRAARLSDNNVRQHVCNASHI